MEKKTGKREETYMTYFIDREICMIQFPGIKCGEYCKSIISIIAL